jgi:hypothetical protein
MLVVYTKCNRLSHEKGFMLLLSGYFLFCFAKGLAKCRFGVFDKSQILHIWTP